jgi:hypothetical protein
MAVSLQERMSATWMDRRRAPYAVRSPRACTSLCPVRPFGREMLPTATTPQAPLPSTSGSCLAVVTSRRARSASPEALRTPLDWDLPGHQLVKNSANKPVPSAIHPFEIIVDSVVVVRSVAAHLRCHVSPDGGLLVPASAAVQFADHIGQRKGPVFRTSSQRPGSGQYLIPRSHTTSVGQNAAKG